MPADAALASSQIDADDTGELPSRGSGAKKLVVLLFLALLLLGGGGAGLMFSGVFDPFGLSGTEAEGDDAGSAKARDPATLVFFDLPDLLVNLSSAGNRPSYLKMRVSLELRDDKEIQKLERLSPRIIDGFQMYLRELRMEDLRGSAGLARLREELLRRVNASVEPIVIQDVLFREMLVQ